MNYFIHDVAVANLLQNHPINMSFCSTDSIKDVETRMRTGFIIGQELMCLCTSVIPSLQYPHLVGLMQLISME